MKNGESGYYWPYQFDILKQLWIGGAIQPGKAKIDYGKAGEIIAADQSVEEYLETGGLVLGRKAMRRAVKSLVDGGVIPRELAVRVGSSFKPGDMVEGEKVSYFYSDYGDRMDLGDRDVLYWGRQMCRGGLNFNYRVLGSGLTQKGVVGARRVAEAGHEYGHGVQTALERMMIESEFGGQLADFSWQDWQGAVTYIRDNLLRLINSVSPVEEKMGGFGEVLNLTENEVGYIQIERIGVGFEMAVLARELTAAGMAAARTGETISRLVESRRRGGIRAAELMAELKESGWGFGECSRILGEINENLRRVSGKDEGPILRTEVSPVDLGYCFPLEVYEIRQVIREVMTGWCGRIEVDVPISRQSVRV